MANKVLIIDDSADFVDAVTALLEAKAYQVTSASNGKEGLAKAKAESPDLILLDVMMTTKSEGFDVAREFKNDPVMCKIPILMITGIRKDMNLAFGFEPDEKWLPVKEVLEKPVRPETLLKAVETYILR